MSQSMPMTLEQQIEDLRSLILTLQKASTLEDKLVQLNRLPQIQNYLSTSPLSFRHFLKDIDPESEYAIKSILVIGQGPVVFNMKGAKEDQLNRLQKLVQHLVSIEQFYQQNGGIIGYHATILSMLANQNAHSSKDDTHYLHPEGFFLGRDEPEVRKSIRWGIENLDRLGEIYPVGGAGDRLNLIDEQTGISLPAAVLPFLGRTLLEGLIRDLQAREYLYFKIYGKQLCTLVAMMTSTEKNNHAHILNICQRNHWFGRPSESFYFFVQPLVPVLTKEGNWSLSSYLTLTLKPGGHGVIWKLAEEQGVFAWLDSHGIDQALVRQINNPLAGTDNSLFALIGIGIMQEKSLGFLSCERLLNAAEGTNILIEKKLPDGFEYCLTNIEYTDFANKGIGEIPAKQESPYSLYPTNTNILYVKISAIKEALKNCPIPGQLINMKSKVSYIDPQGDISWLPGGRLESTMQNIADALTERFPIKLQKHEFAQKLHTFIVFNERQKTISTTKQSYKPGESPISTPEQAYYDMLCNNRHLLKHHCHFNVPPEQTIEEFIQNGPSCLFLFHPGMGPLYSIIKQKVRNGRILSGSELMLEAAEVDIDQLDLKGSLLIESTVPLGTYDPLGFLQYGNESRCRLHHLTIINKGINRQRTSSYWKNQIERDECVRISLKEGAEFEAYHVRLEGSHFFEVPAFHRLSLKPNGKGEWTEELVKIDRPSWHWTYQFDAENQLILKAKYA